MPNHVSVADASHMDQMAETLAGAAAVLVCVPPTATVHALATTAAAAAQLPTMVPNDITVSGRGFDGATPLFDADGRDVPGPGTLSPSGAQNLPFVLMGPGATGKITSSSVVESLTYVNRAVRSAYPSLPSCFSILPPPFSAQWATAVAEAPCSEPLATLYEKTSSQGPLPRPSPTSSHRLPFRASNGSLMMFPPLYIGAADSATMKSRDALQIALAPFQLSWARDPLEGNASHPLHLSDSADAVDHAALLRSAAQYAGALVSVSSAQNPIFEQGVLLNLLNASRQQLTDMRQRPLSPEVLASLHGWLSDTESAAFRFGRRQADHPHPSQCASQLFAGGENSPHFTSLKAALAMLASDQQPYFAGINDTAAGVYRPSTVADTLAVGETDWERTGGGFETIQSGIDQLNDSVVKGTFTDVARRVAEEQRNQGIPSPAAPDIFNAAKNPTSGEPSPTGASNAARDWFNLSDEEK